MLKRPKLQEGACQIHGRRGGDPGRVLAPVGFVEQARSLQGGLGDTGRLPVQPSGIQSSRQVREGDGTVELVGDALGRRHCPLESCCGARHVLAARQGDDFKLPSIRGRDPGAIDLVSQSSEGQQPCCHRRVGLDNDVSEGSRQCRPSRSPLSRRGEQKLNRPINVTVVEPLHRLLNILRRGAVRLVRHALHPVSQPEIEAVDAHHSRPTRFQCDLPVHLSSRLVAPAGARNRSGRATQPPAQQRSNDGTSGPSSEHEATGGETSI